jgi:hypothetical protein
MMIRDDWKKATAKLFLALGFLLLLSTSSRAAAVCPTPAAPPLSTPGFSLLTEQSGNYNVSSGGNGCYAEYIYQNTTTKNLDFVFYVGANVGPVDNISAYNFTGFTTTLSEFPGTLSGSTAYASTNVNSGAVNFNYSTGEIGPSGTGGSSEFLSILTNATTYESGGNLGISDGVEANIADLQPGPEPSTLLLWGTGLLAFVWVSRKKLGFGSDAA